MSFNITPKISEIINKIRTLPKWLMYSIIAGFLIIIISSLILFNSNSGGGNAPDAGLADSSIGLILDVLTKLTFVLIVIFIFALLFNKWRGKNNQKQKEKSLQILETLQIGPKKSLLLVKAGAEVILIGSAEQSLSLIKKIDSIDLEEESDIERGNSFEGTSFQMMLNKKMISNNKP